MASYTIYAIQNKVNKKIYIGRTQNAYQRLQSHLRNLRKGTHIIEDMQKDFDIYGDVFEIFILETNIAPLDKLTEYKYIKKYNSYIRECGYNYKDHLAPKIIFGLPEAKLKSEDEILKLDNRAKGQYMCAIVEHLNKVNDLETLDFMYQFLVKTQGVKNG